MLVLVGSIVEIEEVELSESSSGLSLSIGPGFKCTSPDSSMINIVIHVMVTMAETQNLENRMLHSNVVVREI